MNALMEPRCAPQQVPDLMLLDEEADGGCGDNWMSELASFCVAAVASVAATASAPVPIASHARAQRMSPGSELVDSLESTQTLLGASLAHDAAAVHSQPAQQPPQLDPYAMRFVPVPVAPAPQLEPYQQPQPAARQYWGGERDEGLYGGYGAVAPPQPQPGAYYPHHQEQAPQQYQQDWQYSEDQYHDVQYAAEQHYSAAEHYAPPLPPRLRPAPPSAWEAGPAPLPMPAPPHHRSAAAGISSLDLPYGCSVQFGRQGPMAVPGAMRRAASEDILHSSHHGGAYYERDLLATVAEGGDSMGSEGSDADTLGAHHHHHPAGLPSSHSAPSASLMALERSNSTRRSLHSSSASRGGGHSTASPRPICLKVKTARPRPPAAARAAAAAAAAAAASPRPARLSARRSMALSAAAVADEDLASDSDAEPVASAAVSEEVPRSGGSSGAAAAKDAAAGGKKKHNPWSLTETEALVEGVRLLGPSKWAEIKKLGVNGICDLLTHRSAVDLKDKWRNLTRVAKLPKSVLKARAHKSTSDIPLELLLTVKDLMEASRD